MTIRPADIKQSGVVAVKDAADKMETAIDAWLARARPAPPCIVPYSVGNSDVRAELVRRYEATGAWKADTQNGMLVLTPAP